MNSLNAAFLALVVFASSASAAFWESKDFDCSNRLARQWNRRKPNQLDNNSFNRRGTLVGARRIDLSAFIFRLSSSWLCRSVQAKKFPSQ
jgi:hypothetical protein